MEKLASRHAISELFNWISLMENVIEEDEENLKSAVGSSVIQDYLQKYKVVKVWFARVEHKLVLYRNVYPLQGFRVDLSCKQLTVDFVNQSVLQISGQDVESKRSDKTDFAERLGAMNRRWQILLGRINERVRPPAPPPPTKEEEALTFGRTEFVLCAYRSSSWRAFWRCGWSTRAAFKP